jgi:hypothetical protein
MAADRTVVVLCLLSLAGIGRAAQGSGAVVGRVVTLIEDLKAKIVADGKAEQKMYDKYACWCEGTSARKANDIHKAMADIKALGAKILSNKGLVATRASEISELSKQMKENQRTQDEATSIRQKENAAYSEMKAQMEQTLNALERAIEVLSGAGTKTALLQMGKPKDELTLLRTAAVVHSAIKQLPDEQALSPMQLSMLETFTNDPAEFYDQKAEKKNSYSPASATIQGILKDMYDTFAMNLEKSTETEATQYKNFENVMSAQAKEMKTLSDTKTKKEGEKADAEKVQADTEQELDDTKTQLEASIALFDNTKKICTSKAAEWNERVRARTEELSGINKALEILTSDDAKALFNKAIKPGKETFLQISSVQGVSKPEVRNKVYSVLKNAATASKSLRLASIAATVRASGHFDVVVEAVEKMISDLEKEQKDDFNHKDWCKEETFKNEQEASRYEYKIEKLNGKLAKFHAEVDELEATRAQTIKEIADVRDDIEKMEDKRKEDRATFEGKKADDEGASQLLAAAIESLSAFYKNNDTGMGEIQGSINLLQKSKEPVFEVSADQAPDASFSSAGKSTGASKGIISTLTMIKEDLDDEIANGIKEDVETQTRFEEQLTSAKTLEQDLINKKTDLEESISAANDEIDAHNQEKADRQGDLDAEHEYLWSIKPDCTWILNTFDDRRKKRDTEIAGLRESIGMLQGAMEEANAGGEAMALTQKQVSFDDSSFDRVHFAK